MLNRDNLRDFIPEDGTYKGVARISFRAPDGEVTGPGTIRVSPDGHVVVRVDVEQYSIPREYREFLMGFLQGDLPEPTGTGGTIFRIGGTHRTGTLEVKVSEHCFRSDRALVSRTHGNFFTNENAWFEVVPFGLELSVDAAHSEAIWCMPLFGSLSEFERCANACFVNEQTPYIHFDSDGHACGVLVFPPMDESSDREFSAVIFGEIGGRAHGTLDEISNLLPWGVFAALDFASGSDVRAPWLELRGHDGKLKRRVHLRFGGDIAEEGFPTFSRFDSANPGSGIAEFLRCFFRLPPQQRRSLTPRMTLVRRGAPGSATIDESITNLIKALDATCKRHGFGRESLAGKLDGLNSKAVDQVITEAPYSTK